MFPSDVKEVIIITILLYSSLVIRSWPLLSYLEKNNHVENDNKTIFYYNDVANENDAITVSEREKRGFYKLLSLFYFVLRFLCQK